MKEFDTIVIGSGIAGMSYSLYAKNQRIAILSKGEFDQTNTAWAQGGIASVETSSSDSFEDHTRDTLEAGVNMNDPEVVKMVVNAAPSAIADLQNWGVRFDNALAKEGGHAHKRIWHFEDVTGKEIQRALTAAILKKENIEIFENTAVTDLVKNHTGSFYVQTFQGESFLAKRVVLATGGVGAAYLHTTNQNISTGDAIMLAHHIGCTIKNLCFIQFHPTGLYSKNPTTFLITEALRGAGAILRNKEGEAFMEKYDARKDLAPRDIVSRSIYTEMQLHGTGHVWLDATGIEKNILASHFPNIVKTCSEMQQLDIQKDWIPVVPVQHYSCGGIETDTNGETCIPGLFAIGECAYTGLHGANRLASNSLLEAVVFAKNAAAVPITLEQKNIIHQPTKIKSLPRHSLQEKMSATAGVVRSTAAMQEVLNTIKEEITKAPVLPAPTLFDIETNNLYELSILILEDALSQKENKGVHFNTALCK